MSLSRCPTDNSSSRINSSVPLINSSSPATPPESFDPQVFPSSLIHGDNLLPQDDQIASDPHSESNSCNGNTSSSLPCTDSYQYPLKHSRTPSFLRKFNESIENVSYKCLDHSPPDSVPGDFSISLVPQRNFLYSHSSLPPKIISIDRNKRIKLDNSISSNSDNFPPSPKVDTSNTVSPGSKPISEDLEDLNLQSIVQTFEDLPEGIQSYAFFQLLRSCNRQSMRLLLNECEPLLKKDILSNLPFSIVQSILLNLDIHSFLSCRLVSPTWNRILDVHTSYWKHMFSLFGFQINENDWKYANPTLNRPPFLHNDQISDDYFPEIFKRHFLNRKRWLFPSIPPSHLSFPIHVPNFMITSLLLHKDRIITTSGSGTIQIHNAITGVLEARLEGHKEGVWAVKIHENTLVSGSIDKTVRVWNIEKAKCTHIFRGHISIIRCLEILVPSRLIRHGVEIVEPDQPYIVSGSRDHTLRVWKLPKNTDPPYLPDNTNSIDRWEKNPYFVHTLIGHTDSVRTISGYGDILVSGSYDSSIRVWRVSTGECLYHLRGHSLRIYSVLYEPERNICISGSMDKSIRVWDLSTGTCKYVLEGHDAFVTLLNVFQNRLISGSADSTIRIWDLNTGKPLMVLPSNSGYISSFVSDEHKIISGNDGSVKLWDVRTGKLLRFLLTDLTKIWHVDFDAMRCVAAVQRDDQAYLEVINFSGSRP